MRYVLAVLCLTPALALAQSRPGLVIAAGGGIASTSITCDGCTATRTLAPGGFLRVGGGISRYVAFAGELSLWRAADAAERSTYRYVTLTTTVYPSPSQGFYLAAHLGHAQATDNVSTSLGTFRFSSSGIAFGGGVGYEIPVSPTWAVTPYLDALGMSGSGTQESVTGNVLHAGVALTFRRR